MTLTIRPALAADAPDLLRLIRELARYEQAEDKVLATEADLARTLFAPGAAARALLAEAAGEAVGYAVYFTSYSTWLGRNGIYLEDLYVSPARRGQGAGRALMRHLAAEAVAQGCGRLEWSVLDWNAPAIRFYDSLGATPHSEWIRYRLDGDALQALAAEAPATVPEGAIELTATPAPADLEALSRALGAFNDADVGPANRKPLAVFRREGGRIVAGLSGYTAWGWLYVQWLWVDEGLRGQGVAGRMLAAAEAEAKARGCHGALIDTFSPVGAHTYEKQGYARFGAVADFPPGRSRIYLQKRL